MISFNDPAVKATFDEMPAPHRTGALALRQLIFDTAESIENLGPVTECLRWGQPSYVTKIGSTLRVGLPKTGGFALFAHCQSSIIADFADLFGADFTIEGNRAVVFNSIADIQPEKLRLMIEHGLTYKRKR